MSLHTQLQATATEAQRTLAQLTGMAPTATGNLTGVDGHPYTAVIRSANAFELAEIERGPDTHGYQDREILIATLTRNQFTTAPLGWRRGVLTLLESPPRTATVHSISTADPLHYALVLLTYQPRATQ